MEKEGIDMRGPRSMSKSAMVVKTFAVVSSAGSEVDGKDDDVDPQRDAHDDHDPQAQRPGPGAKLAQLLLSQPPLHCPQMALTRLRLFDKSKVN